MIDLGLIEPHAEIVGADGVHVGTVDHVAGDLVALAESGARDGPVRHISGDRVARVQNGVVYLDVKAEEVVAFAEDTSYRP